MQLARFVLALNEPAAHGAQIRSCTLDPAIVTNEPGPQSVHALQVPAFALVLNCPVAQLVHTRSVLVVPAALTYKPGAQLVHALHALALLAELKVPAAQLAHERSLVAVPSLCTNCPATHVVLLTHGVDGSPSSSQVPAAQAISVAVPPAHQPPAVQAWHTAGAELVAGAVCVVPAAHAVTGKHAATFTVVLTVPAAQTSQARSVLAEGVFVECVPGWQSLQIAHAV